jgi:hypothetical protein
VAFVPTVIVLLNVPEVALIAPVTDNALLFQLNLLPKEN